MGDKWQKLRRVCEATGWKWVSVGVPRPELRDLLAERDALEAERDDHLQECRNLIANRDALAQEVERLRAELGDANEDANMLCHEVGQLKAEVERLRAATASKVDDLARRIGPAASVAWVREQLEKLSSRIAGVK